MQTLTRIVGTSLEDGEAAMLAFVAMSLYIGAYFAASVPAAVFFLAVVATVFALWAAAMVGRRFVVDIESRLIVRESPYFATQKKYAFSEFKRVRRFVKTDYESDGCGIYVVVERLDAAEHFVFYHFHEPSIKLAREHSISLQLAEQLSQAIGVDFKDDLTLEK